MATFGTKQWFRDILSELLETKKVYVQTNNKTVRVTNSVKGNIRLSIKLPTRHDGNDWEVIS